MHFTYPEMSSDAHEKIVNKLLLGEFVPIGNKLYETLAAYTEWYEGFFLKSFGIELIHKEEVFYCVNNLGNMNTTKDILTTMAILMYEISKTGDDPVVAIQDRDFSANIINKYISESIQFSRYAEDGKVDNRFINKLEQLGLIKKTQGNYFVFTKAIDVFLKEYDDLMEQIGGLT
jgi:hypothetical protein